MKTQKRILIIPILVSQAISTFASANDLEVDVSTALGTDSNPFRLSEVLAPSSETYWANDLAVNYAATENLSIKARVRDFKYFSDKRADAQTLFAAIDYKSTFDACQCELEVGVDYYNFDRTYVSRFRGDVLTVGATSLADRYDSSMLRPTAGLTYAIDNVHKLSVKTQYNQVTYSDFNDIGLDNLDYDQLELEGEWEYKPNIRYRVRSFASFNLRKYDERLAVDSIGQDILGLSSEYQYAEAGVKTRLKLIDRHWLYTDLSYQDRQDNGQGYYNYQQARVTMRWFAQYDNDLKTDLSLRFNNLSYSRDIVVDQVGNIENNDETPSTRGWRVQGKISKLIYRYQNVPIEAFVNATYHNIAAQINAYEFDRVQLESGLSVKF